MKSIKSFISIALLVIFLLPTAEKLSHELGHHHEDACHENDTHICASDHGCEVCSFTYSAFTPGVINEVNLLAQIVTKPVIQNYNSELKSELHSVFQRGPPAIV